MNIIHDLPPSFPDNTYVAIDTEIFGMNEKQMHRPISGTFACLTVCADPETVYITQNEKDVPEVLRRLDNCIWVLQNAKFDLIQLRRWANVPPRTRLIDTMLIERILWNGYYDRFGEDALARRYLDIALDKSLQKAFSKATEMTPEMIEYACKDPSTDLRVWKEGQKPLLTKTDMKVWREIDLPCMWAVMDFQGFRLDVDKWRALAERNKARQMELKGQLPFNPNSNPKSLEFYNKNGFKRIPNNQKETLEFFINKYPNTKAAECARIALDSKQYGTWASRYGMNFIDDYLEWEDDIALIHCNYWITGAETFRLSADDPAMHQIPVRETKEFRECFIARPNQKLIIVDWCGQEIGIQAFLADDRKMKEIFNSGQDIYILMAKEMLGKTIEKSDPLRPTMKAVVSSP